MIRINLQQAAQKPRRRKAAAPAADAGGGGGSSSGWSGVPGTLLPALLLLAPVLGGLGGSYFVHGRLLARIADVQQATRTAEAEIAKLKPVLDEIERFKKDKALLEQKLAAMKALEGARRGPVKIYDELAAIMPQQVWVTGIREQAMSATIEAVGLDSQSVAVFVMAMQRSPYFADVELTVVEQIGYLGLKVKKFGVTCRFRLPQDQPPPARPAGVAPAAAGAAAAVR